MARSKKAEIEATLVRTVHSARVLVSLLAIAFGGAQAAVAQQPDIGTDQTHPSLQAIVSGMEQAQEENRQSYHPYTLTREYRFYGAEVTSQPKSEVVARITFVPPNTTNYTIEKAEGNSRGENVVRHLLQSESDACAKQTASGAITSKNYEFKLLGQDLLDGRPVWVLQATARHPEKDLINGKVWVDKSTYLVHHMEGELSKSPSWWLKSVHTTVTFSDANGMWLRTSMTAVADVRFFGPHIVTDQAVKIQTGDQVADLRFTANKSSTRRTAVRPYGTLVLRR